MTRTLNFGRFIWNASGAAAMMLTIAGASADELSENLKGSGEVVITTGGGTWEEAQRKAFFEPCTRDTGIEVVLVQANNAKLLPTVNIRQPHADITPLTGHICHVF